MAGWVPLADKMLYSLANRGRDPRPKWKMDN